MEEGTRSLEKHGVKRDHVSIEIMNEDDLVSSIKEKMDSISLSHCVCRVPQELSKGYEEQYFPRSVSIGPFHHDKDTLKANEDQKWRYVNTLLCRKTNTEATLDSCIRALRHAEQKARKFYGDKIELGNDQFVEMMLVDGCFIIELFLEYAIKSLRRRDDPFFSTSGGRFHLRCDLILLENQLPFFILDQLFHLVPIPKHCNKSLIELALFFFRKLIPGNHSQIFASETHHLLDLIRQHYLPTAPQILSSRGQKLIHHATYLRAVGLRFEKSTSESPLNITFSNGELNIPSLEIHGYTETLFRNLIAMELCHPGCPKLVTSYAILMERLIQFKNDVGLLQDKEIIIDGLYRDGQIVILFKKLHVDIDVKEFKYGGICEEINGYQPRKRQVWWGSIRHIYHRTRLGMAGFSLATLLLVFLFTGALFSVLSFLLHHFR